MKRISGGVVAALALAYLLLEQVWVFAANSAWVGDQARPLLKAACLGIAALVFVASSAAIAAHQRAEWLWSTALNAGAAAAAGTVLMVAVSALWQHSLFFHDSGIAERLPFLAVVAVLAGIAASLLSLPVGAVARLAHTKVVQ